MTGNGLVKFEKFSVMNKLPWDDENDQFVIQVYSSKFLVLNQFMKEPGVYAVFASAILQEAFLTVKVSSNMHEREVVDLKLTYQ